MLRSMTGYGRSERTINEKNFIIEIRSLNGKQFELLLKMPVQIKPFEFDVRSLLAEKLIRGSVECTVTIKQNGATKPSSINLDLAASYFKQLKTLADQLQADDSQLLSSILRLPEVVATSNDVLTEQEWEVFKEALQDAMTMINKHRMDEGAVLEKELLSRIANIEKSQQQVIALDPSRKVKIRESILKLLDEQVGKDNVDMNRFEQELIYYIEKIDLTEEQVRLTNHCNYFRTLLQENEIAKGRKLSFLLQEIGREINTTGSKAYDATIRRQLLK